MKTHHSSTLVHHLLNFQFRLNKQRTTHCLLKFQIINKRLVQVNFNQADQFDPVKSRQILQRLFDLSLAPGLEQVTHIVWPEGAVLGLAMQDYNFLESMGRALVQVDDSPPIWLLQSLRHQSQTDPKTGRVRDSYYNSAVAVEFDAQGRPTIAAYNDKHRLVPFGEFIPGGDWIADNLPVISASLSSLSPAPQKTLSNFPGLPRLSAQICYEAIFPGLMPRDEKNPAQLILTQSNDAWYGRSWGPWQHANIARYRAIEEGVPMVRVAANGISGIVNAYGQMPLQLTMKSESHIDTTLPKYLNINKKTKLNSLILGLLNLIIALLCAPLFHARQHS